MYQYKYVNSKGGTLFFEANHREIIDKHAKEGWRFVTAIPTYQKSNGAVEIFDLVFEKKYE